MLYARLHFTLFFKHLFVNAIIIPAYKIDSKYTPVNYIAQFTLDRNQCIKWLTMLIGLTCTLAC